MHSVQYVDHLPTDSRTWVIDELEVAARSLGRPWRVLVQRPVSALGPEPLPWIWFLHGRSASVADMRPVLAALARAMDDGAVPPYVVAVPDAPDGHRESWWIDSDYRPPDDAPHDELSRRPGLPLESSLLLEALPAIEARYGGPDTPAQRIIAGISMGGGAALRWAITHPETFGAALLLSPAVFEQSVPPGSAMRQPGPYNVESQIFDTGTYGRVLHYPTLLSQRPVRDTVTPVVTVVGDREAPRMAGAERHDLDLEAARLHASLKLRPDFASSLRIIDGDHDWPTWERAVVLALEVLTKRAGDAT